LNKIIVFFACLFLLHFISCYEAIEGCTDPLAENYSFEADEKCSKCCTYPKLLVTIDHRWGTEIFQNGKQYTNNVGSVFVLNSHKFYLTDIKIFNDKNAEIENQKLNSFTIDGEETNLTQNYCLINGTLQECASGSFNFLGKISQLSFNFSLPQALNRADSISISKDNSLSWSEGMYREKEYKSIFLNITSVGTTVSNYGIYLKINQVVPINLVNVSHLNRGKQIEIPITLNYQELFKNIDFKNSQEITKALENNLKTSFKLK
jgi:hypothetical protein